MPLPTEPVGIQTAELWTGQRLVGKRRRLAGRTRAFRTACASRQRGVVCEHVEASREFALRQSHYDSSNSRSPR